MIIAEAGVNHNGDPALARKLIDLAARAGADAVKFQTFRAEKIVTRQAEKAAYQKAAMGSSQSQFDMLKGLELSEDDFLGLADHCRVKGITFLSTPFDSESLDFLVNETGMATIKIPSGEVVNGPLLLHAARAGKDIIMSTGMSDLEEIKAALSVLAFGLVGSNSMPDRGAFEAAFASDEGQRKLREKVTLLHCTSQYPAPFDGINLLAMDTIRKAFGLSIGFSDHSKGTAIPLAAVALGAVVIEKHFTLDRDMAGPDHQASLSPDELHKMVADIRSTEAALGDGEKVPTKEEAVNRGIVRQSVVAAKKIAKGEPFTADNLTTKRPGTGRSPMAMFDIFGNFAERNYDLDELID